MNNSLAANALLTSQGIYDTRHSVLRENLSHYNAQLRTPVSDLWDTVDSNCERTPEEHRFVRKIRRDLEFPYTDQDVARKAEQLDADLLKLLSVKGTKFPSQVYLVGGINKGRFGGASDLDVLANGLLSDKACGYLAAQEGWQVFREVNAAGETVSQAVSSPHGVHAEFRTGVQFEALSNWFGKRFVVNVEQPRGAVKEAIQQGFEAKGYQVEWGPDGLHLEGTGTSPPELEVNREYPFPDVEKQRVAGKKATLLDQMGDWLRSGF